MDSRITKETTIYYARIMPTIGIYDLLEAKIRTVDETWFVAIDIKARHAYMFNDSDVGRVVFFTREEALAVVKAAESNKQNVSNETYYEEY